MHCVPAVLAVALLLSASTPAVQAAAACPPGLTKEQCKICSFSSAPTKCYACIATAKASNEADMTALTCMVCGSLATPALQDFCSNCVKTSGYNAGCSTCAGGALFGLPKDTKPTAKGLASAGGCYSCYSKAAPELLNTPACVSCWAPTSSDPAACSSCVAGATGVPAAARASCFGCYLKDSADPAGCASCLKGAKTTAASQLCPLCAGGPSGKDAQKQCYTCMDGVKASLPGVRWLCHFTGTADGNKATAALTAAVPAYYKCLAAAGTLQEGQACRKCMDQIEKSGAKSGNACFAALA